MTWFDCNISDFLVTQSSIRQMANFINYPGDYRHKCGQQKIWPKIWRLEIWRRGDVVQNLETPGLSGRVDSPVCWFLICGKLDIFYM